MTFKPDFGAGKENAKTVPWFKAGSVYHSAENPRKTGFLGKAPLSEQTPVERGVQKQQGCGFSFLTDHFC